MYYPGQPLMCRNCGGHRYVQSDCKEVACRRCGKLGHLAKDCNSALVCNLCGATGHVFKDCVKRARSFADIVRGKNLPGKDVGDMAANVWWRPVVSQETEEPAGGEKAVGSFEDTTAGEGQTVSPSEAAPGLLEVDNRVTEEGRVDPFEWSTVGTRRKRGRGSRKGPGRGDLSLAQANRCNALLTSDEEEGPSTTIGLGLEETAISSKVIEGEDGLSDRGSEREDVCGEGVISGDAAGPSKIATGCAKLAELRRKKKNKAQRASFYESIGEPAKRVRDGSSDELNSHEEKRSKEGISTLFELGPSLQSFSEQGILAVTQLKEEKEGEELGKVQEGEGEERREEERLVGLSGQIVEETSLETGSPEILSIPSFMNVSPVSSVECLTPGPFVGVEGNSNLDNLLKLLQFLIF
ncbi:ZCHC3 protein, partial [Atractosteus spatula]|nr:ZCHC3 protein [Atractosteus spatula]